MPATGNWFKDRLATVDAFATKAVDALDAGVHLLVVDLFPPGRDDPEGMHAKIWQRLNGTDAQYELPPDEPLTVVSYAAGPNVEVYLEHLAAGAPMPEMPLFLQPDRYVDAPLEGTYQEAFRGMPGFWRDVLEGRP